MNEQYQFEVGDLLIGNADSESKHINVMLIVHREYAPINQLISEELGPGYIISKDGKRSYLQERLILKYIESGKVSVIKRKKHT